MYWRVRLTPPPIPLGEWITTGLKTEEQRGVKLPTFYLRKSAIICSPLRAPRYLDYTASHEQRRPVGTAPGLLSQGSRQTLPRRRVALGRLVPPAIPATCLLTVEGSGESHRRYWRRQSNR